MYPVNFEEFMVYMGEEILLDHIRECFEKSQPLDRQMHNKAMHLFMEYMLVGGMPQAIVAFKKNGRDFHAADVEKRDILAFYEDDITDLEKVKKVNKLLIGDKAFETVMNRAAYDVGGFVFEHSNFMYDSCLAHQDSQYCCDIQQLQQT